MLDLELASGLLKEPSVFLTKESSMKKALLIVAMMAGLSACSVSTSSKNPIPPELMGKPGGPNVGSQHGVRASSQTTLQSLENSGALLARTTLSGEMYLSNGNNIGYRRASEIDVGIHGGSYCIFNLRRTASGPLMKITRVQMGMIYSPARNYDGVKITFEDGGSLHLIHATLTSTVADIERTCLGSYAEFRTL